MTEPLEGPTERVEHRHLGIIDWGIGGLDLTQRIQRGCPDLAITYWSDTGARPYGLMARRELVLRLTAVVDELAEQGCSEVVLACNAASTALGALGGCPVPVSGVIEAAASVVPASAKKVAVLGGARTIRSGAHRRVLAQPGRTVVGRVAQPLSAHIEAARVNSPEFREDLRAIVAPLGDADAVVLACTHYPAAAKAFEQALPQAKVLNPVVGLARELIGRFGGSTGKSPASLKPVRYLSTGDPQAMVKGALAAWGINLVAEPAGGSHPGGAHRQR